MPELPYLHGLEPSPGAKRRGDLSGWHVAATSVFGERKKTSSGSPGTIRKQFLTSTERGDRLSVEHLLRDKRALVDINWKYEDNGDSALIRAARGQDEAMVRLLLMNGADVTLKNNDQQQAIEVAQFHIQEMLLCPNRDKLFAHAAWQGDEKAIKEWLKRRPDCEAENSEGRHALLILAESPRVFATLEKALLRNYRPAAVVQQLASCTNDMNVCDEDGRSALHLAVESDNDYALSVAVALVDTGFNTDARDKSSRTPLHTAAQCGHTDMLEILLNHGANVNAIDNKGASALHHSAQGGHSEACDLLLEQGADPAHKDRGGQWPHDVASSPSLHKRLKQAWQESSTVREADSRLESARMPRSSRSGLGGSHSDDGSAYDSDDSIADETMMNIVEDIDDGEDPAYKPSLFITEGASGTRHAMASGRRKSKEAGALAKETRTSGRSTEHSSTDETDGAPGAADAATTNANRHVRAGRADTGDERRGNVSATSRSANGGVQFPPAAGRNTSSSKTNSATTDTNTGGESPKKRHRKLRKQGSKAAAAATAAKPSTQSKPSTARVSRPQLSSQSSDAKSKAKPSAKAPDTRRTVTTAGRRSMSSDRADLPSQRAGPGSRVTPRKTTGLSQPDRQRNDKLPHANRQHVKLNVATADGLTESGQGGTDNAYLGNRRDSLPALSSRARHKSATPRDPPSQGISAIAMLEISFNVDVQKTPVVTKWQHDPSYLRQKAQLESESGTTDSAQMTRRPNGAAATGRQVPSKDLVLPALQPVSMGLGSSDDATPPVRVRSKTLGGADPNMQSNCSLNTSDLSLIGHSSRSNLHERSPKTHRNNVELPHLDAGGAKLDSRRLQLRKSSDDLLRRATTRNTRDKSPSNGRHNQLSPLDHHRSPPASQSNSSVGIPTHSALSTSSTTSTSSTEGPVHTGEIYVTEENVRSFVEALEMDGLSPDTLLAAGAGSANSLVRSLSAMPGSRSESRSEEVDVIVGKPPHIMISPSSVDASSDVAGSAAMTSSSDPPTSHDVHRAALLPERTQDQDDMLQALHDAQCSPSDDITGLDQSSVSPVQVFTATMSASEADALRDQLVGAIPHHEHRGGGHVRRADDDDAARGPGDAEQKGHEDYSPVMTAYIGRSRPASATSVLAASASRDPSRFLLSRPSTANRSRLLASRPSTANRSLATMSQSTQSLSNSNFSALLDDDAVDDDLLVFRKGKLLGAGGFGRVYMCLLNNGETIALKEMELNIDQNVAEEEFANIQEEVNTLKLLDHVNIVKYYGAALVEGSCENFKVRIFMELIAGGSIADFVKNGVLSMRVCRVYTQQILYAVDYLHEMMNIIHRDIKGANIMVTTHGIVKLVDFGTAKRHLNMHDLTNQLKGTPYWMAPEVFRDGVCDKPVDIWSVGCTVFEMAIGHHPWYGLEVPAAIFAIGSYRVPEELESVKLPSIVRDFIKKCMTTDPKRRPSAGELLRHHKFMQFQSRKPGSQPRIGRDSLPEKLPSPLPHWKSPERRW